MNERKTKLPASEWLPFFLKADVLTEVLNKARSAKAKAIKIGQFLSPNVNRIVPILVKGRSGRATLRVESKGHAKEKRYYFDIEWDETLVEKKGTVKKPGGKKSTTEPKPAVAATTPTKAKPASPTAKNSPTKPANTGNDEEWE